MICNHFLHNNLFPICDTEMSGRGRGKVVLERIANRSKRIACQKKRSAGLLKKAHELATLCNIPVALIAYGPDHDDPITWPTSRDEVNAVVQEYLQKPESERTKHGETHESFLERKTKKKDEKLKQVSAKNDALRSEALVTAYVKGEMSLAAIKATPNANVIDAAKRLRKKLVEILQNREPKQTVDGHDSNPLVAPGDAVVGSGDPLVAPSDAVVVGSGDPLVRSGDTLVGSGETSVGFNLPKRRGFQLTYEFLSGDSNQPRPSSHGNA